MTRRECEQERKQLQEIQEIKVSGVGFVCAGGFDFQSREEYILIGGEDLYH